MNSNTDLLISRHLSLITHDATVSVNSSIKSTTGKYGSVSPHVKESGIQEIFLVESGMQLPLMIGIRTPSSTDEESSIQYLESGIQGVESGIQGCVGFPYIGRAVSSFHLNDHSIGFHPQTQKLEPSCKA